MKNAYRLVLMILFLLCSCQNGPDHHFIKIQGTQQHTLTWGKGLPVVVFLCGGGSSLEDFEIVQQEIAKHTKTFSYDKPGIGQSELINMPRTLDNVVEELKQLLAYEGINNVPIIFVGHSMGGFVARYYLHRYPKNIKGLVLIDPGSEFLEEEWRKIQTQEEMILEDSILAAQIQLIPQGFRMEVEAYPKHDSLLKTFSIKTDIPITLLESTKVEADDPAEQRMIELQSQLYNRFQLQAPQTKIISTSKSGHFIQIDEPKLVISAIMEMLKN